MERKLREQAFEEAAKKRRKLEESEKMLSGAASTMKPAAHMAASDFKMLHSLISKPQSSQKARGIIVDEDEAFDQPEYEEPEEVKVSEVLDTQ